LTDVNAKYIKSVTVAPGDSEIIFFETKEGPTWYDQYSKIYFNFTYDGKNYGGCVSSYYGGEYWEV